MKTLFHIAVYWCHTSKKYFKFLIFNFEVIIYKCKIPTNGRLLVAYLNNIVLHPDIKMQHSESSIVISDIIIPVFWCHMTLCRHILTLWQYNLSLYGYNYLYIIYYTRRILTYHRHIITYTFITPYAVITIYFVNINKKINNRPKCCVLMLRASS